MDTACLLLPAHLCMHRLWCWLHRILAPVKILSQVQAATDLLICSPLELPQWLKEVELNIEILSEYCCFWRNRNSSWILLFLTKRRDELSCSMWPLLDVSYADTEKNFTFATSFTIWFWICLANKLIILFCVYQLMYEALRGAFLNASIVALSAASKNRLIVTLKTQVVIRFLSAKATAVSVNT